MEKGIGAVELASFFGVLRQIIYRWVAAGIISRNSSGRFDLNPCVKAVYKHMQKQAAGLDDANGVARAHSLQASAGLKQSQRELVEQRLRRESGKWSVVAPTAEVRARLRSGQVRHSDQESIARNHTSLSFLSQRATKS